MKNLPTNNIPVLAKIFLELIKSSKIAFATEEYFYFDSYDYNKIAKECNGQVMIEQTYIYTKLPPSMVFRINIQEFYNYQVKRGDARSVLMKQAEYKNPNLPWDHPSNTQSTLSK